MADYFSGSLLRRRLFSGSAWAFGGKIGGATIGVVTNGLLARLLSPQEFGAYFLAISVVSLGAVIGSLGLAKPAVRFVAEDMGLNRSGPLRRAICTMPGSGVLGALIVSFPYPPSAGQLAGTY